MRGDRGVGRRCAVALALGGEGRNEGRGQRPFGEQVPHVNMLNLCIVGFKLLPGLRLVGSSRFKHEGSPARRHRPFGGNSKIEGYEPQRHKAHKDLSRLCVFVPLWLKITMLCQI